MQVFTSNTHYLHSFLGATNIRIFGMSDEKVFKSIAVLVTAMAVLSVIGLLFCIYRTFEQ